MNANTSNQHLPAANFHLISACNMHCKFCFEHHNYGFEINLEKQKQIIRILAQNQVRKINFVGGEVLLYNHIAELIAYAKQQGLTTSIVTNAWLLSPEWIQQVKGTLDWLGISFDSASRSTNLKLGRATRRQQTVDAEKLKRLADAAHKNGIKLKINTVVNSENYRENLASIIKQCKPQRWKVLQMLVLDTNPKAAQFRCSTSQFNDFVARHRRCGLQPVVENAEAIINSYLMIDSKGYLRGNHNGKHHFSSKSILEMPFNEALDEMHYSFEKFEARGGLYQWNEKKQAMKHYQFTQHFVERMHQYGLNAMLIDQMLDSRLYREIWENNRKIYRFSRQQLQSLFSITDEPFHSLLATWSQFSIIALENRLITCYPNFSDVH